jgi:hypothetical protein
MINQSILRKVLAVGITLLLAAGESKALDPYTSGAHYVMVKTSPGVQSIYVVGIWGDSPWIASPETKAYRWLSPTPGWHYTGFMALNETQLQVLTFTSPDCTYGYTAKRVLTVPSNDGLKIIWVDASQPDPW